MGAIFEPALRIQSNFDGPLSGSLHLGHHHIGWRQKEHPQPSNSGTRLTRNPWLYGETGRGEVARAGKLSGKWKQGRQGTGGFRVQEGHVTRYVPGYPMLGLRGWGAGEIGFEGL